MAVEETVYGLRTEVASTLEEALARTREALKQEGFGVLTEIDVKQALKEKIGVDFRAYRILGACNPQLAHQALTRELEIGLLLPCNVIVYEQGTGCVVAALDPEKALEVAKNPQLADLAREAKARLERAVAALGRQ